MQAGFVYGNDPLARSESHDDLVKIAGQRTRPAEGGDAIGKGSAHKFIETSHHLDASVPNAGSGARWCELDHSGSSRLTRVCPPRGDRRPAFGQSHVVEALANPVQVEGRFHVARVFGDQWLQNSQRLSVVQRGGQQLATRLADPFSHEMRRTQILLGLGVGGIEAGQAVGQFQRTGSGARRPADRSRSGPAGRRWRSTRRPAGV